MTQIKLITEINAPIKSCFNISRDIDVHILSTTKTKEKAIAGRTSGLCQQGDFITWQAVHFGIRQKLTVEITQLKFPYFFEDKMIKGAFKSMNHKHFFEFKNNSTIMLDEFNYDVPYGLIGKLFNYFMLKKYMTKFLKTRNNVIKQIAENTLTINQTLI